jgi:8-oxo-dGTP diphosphatase
LWEFPGGKREAGETIEECLVRECQEELGVLIEVGCLLAENAFSYPDMNLRFYFFRAKIAHGKVTAKVHSQVKWAKPADLGQFDFCPADIPALELVRAGL